MLYEYKIIFLHTTRNLQDMPHITAAGSFQGEENGVNIELRPAVDPGNELGRTRAIGLTVEWKPTKRGDEYSPCLNVFEYLLQLRQTSQWQGFDNP